jgi:isopenicillin-N epimerase
MESSNKSEARNPKSEIRNPNPETPPPKAWDFGFIRQQVLLDPTVVNLNTGSFGPLSRVVFERVTALRQRLAEEPMDFLVRQMPPLLWQARQRLAGFLGTQPQWLVFTANVTAAINLIAASLRLAAPGEILLTDHEYGAMHWCWERAAQRQGLTVRTFALPTLARDPGEIVAALREALSERTRLLFFSHVLSPTGLVLPARDLCAEARRRGVLTVVDGAHAPAMVPLDLDEMGCDFYGGNCHKWLLAPTGAGFLWFAPGNEERLQPLQVSWGWKHERDRLDEPDEFGTTPQLRFLEFEGTRDVCPWLAVPAAIDFQERIGWERIRAHNAALVNHVRRRLTGLAGLQLATPDHSQLHGFMTAFRLPPGHDPAVLRQLLWEHRIEAPIVERPGELLLRLSTHFYNTVEEIDHLAEVWPGCCR